MNVEAPSAAEVLTSTSIRESVQEKDLSHQTNVNRCLLDPSKLTPETGPMNVRSVGNHLPEAPT